MIAAAKAKTCKWCPERLQPIPAAPDFTFCPTCDRRKCGVCGYAEQDTTATRCSSCKAEYDS